jgi:hypothetical protein
MADTCLESIVYMGEHSGSLEAGLAMPRTPFWIASIMERSTPDQLGVIAARPEAMARKR